jgi:hypothetical protein
MREWQLAQTGLLPCAAMLDAVSANVPPAGGVRAVGDPRPPFPPLVSLR